MQSDLSKIVPATLLKSFSVMGTVFTRVGARGAYLILGSERGGRHYFEGDALSRETLIKYTKKISKYFQLVSLITQ